MNLQKTAKDLDQAFFYILLAILFLNSLMYLFVFILNWEAWFFGMKMDGADAGTILFTYFFIPGILAYLLFRYPQKVSLIALLSVLFFSFKFIDSSVTIQGLSGGVNLYSGFMATMMVVPLVVLIGHLITTRFYKSEKKTDDNNKAEKQAELIINKPEDEKKDDCPAVLILVLGLATFAFVFLFGPLMLSILFSCLTSSASTPAPVITGNSVISKVDANGTLEWQTVINGYSDYPQEVCSSNDGGYVMAGMFFIGEQSRNLRVMKFDTSGSVIWDLNRSFSAYPEDYIYTVDMILPTAGEYTLIMGNGIVIRLDEEGNELWHRYYPCEKRIVDSIVLPGGGYLLIGEVNEEGADGWKKFDGWILCADNEGKTVWEKKEKDFTYCREVVMSSEGYILLNCYAGCYDPDVACSDPEQSGYMIVALDLQGNYLWKTRFIENVDGNVYSIEPKDKGKIEVNLRGEGERKYTLDNEGNVLMEEFLPARPDSYNHEVALYRKYYVEPLTGNRVQVTVTEADGSENVLVIDYPKNITSMPEVFSVNPISDGGYIVAGAEKR